MRRSRHFLLFYPNFTFIGRDNRQVQYQWLPRRLLLVRHGESEANVNRAVYSTTPDWRIRLTERGKDQAFDCGRRLRRIIGNEKIYIYYSPYRRAQQTLEEIRKSLDASQVQGEREDERLREQEMGNYQPMADMDATWAARNRFSRLYYRFPSGESSADVGDRVSSFFDCLLRERIGLTVPNMNEGALTDAAEEVAWLGLGRWSGREADGVHGTGTPVRSSGAGRYSRHVPRAPSQTTLSLDDLTSTHPSDDSSLPSRLDSAEGYRHDIVVPDGSIDAALRGSSTSLSRPCAHPMDELDAAMDRGVLPPNDLGAAAGDDQNVAIVAHGLLIRLFVGRWFGVPMEVFETMCNPPNCAIVVLERNDAVGRLVMTDVSKQLFGSDPLLQMMRFDGREDTQWYRKRFLGIIDPEKDAARSMQGEDDDENHYSKSKTPHEYEPPASLRDNPPVRRPRRPGEEASPSAESGDVKAHDGKTHGTHRASTGPPPSSSSASPPEGRVHPHAKPASPTSTKATSLPDWTFELTAGEVPNIGPDPTGKTSPETDARVRHYLSRGFW